MAVRALTFLELHATVFSGANGLKIAWDDLCSSTRANPLPSARKCSVLISGGLSGKRGWSSKEV